MEREGSEVKNQRVRAPSLVSGSGRTVHGWAGAARAAMAGAVDDETFLTRLEAAAGRASLTRASADLAPWLTDWRGRVTGDALAMVSPKSTREVQAIVRLAAEARVAIVPQGGNTGMVAGSVPEPGGRSLLLSLRRMNAIRAADAGDNSLVCEAGAVLGDVHRAAEAVGRRFPLALGSSGSATMGGLAATNAGGSQVMRFGMMRALTLGIEAVLADGSVFEGLSCLRKDNRGYDLKQLLIGAEGTLGVITALSLRLVAAAPMRVVAWAGVESPRAALTVLRALEEETGGAIESFELIAADALALVLRHIPGTRDPLGANFPWHVLVEARRPLSDPLLGDNLETLLATAITSGLLANVAISKSEAQAAAFWKLRDSIAEAERIDGVSAKHDIAVPVSMMPDFIIEATKKVEERFAGSRVLAFGHLGDGNIHFNVRASAGVDASDWLASEGERVNTFVHDLAVAAGGSYSAEHGIGRLKRGELQRLGKPAQLAAMQAIKAALDPLGIMNPGVLLPLANPGRTP